MDHEATVAADVVHVDRQALDPVVDNAQTQYEFVRVRGGFKASRQTDASKARVEVG